MTHRQARSSVALIVVACATLVVVVWHLLQGSPPIKRGASLVPTVTEVGPVADRRAVAETLDRAVVPGPKILLTVRSISGGLLDSAILDQGADVLRVPGALEVPAGSGVAIVSAPGYAFKKIDIQDSDVDVALVPGYSIRGRVFDVVTGDPASLVLELREADAQVVVNRIEVDDTGEFTSLAVPPGQYMVYGERSGYAKVAADPRSPLPGLSLDVVASDLWIEIPIFPLYVGVLALENATNLDERVFEGLVTTRSRSVSGIPTPRSQAPQLETKLAAAASTEGFGPLFVTVRTMVRREGSPVASVDLMLSGELYSSVSFPLRPVEEVLGSPHPTVVAVNRQWRTGALTVQAQVPLKLTGRGSFFAGGVTLPPGENRLTLPLGEYLITPPGVGSLLSDRDWSRKVSVPEQNRVLIEPESGFAVLTLEKSEAWREGMLEVSGEGRVFSLWPHAEFPWTVYATPGEYSCRVVMSGSRSSLYSTVWSERVRLVDGQRLTMLIGDGR